MSYPPRTIQLIALYSSTLQCITQTLHPPIKMNKTLVFLAVAMVIVSLGSVKGSWLSIFPEYMYYPTLPQGSLNLLDLLQVTKWSEGNDRHDDDQVKQEVAILM